MSELTPKKIKNGIIGITKAALGIDKSNIELIAKRMRICNSNTCGYCIKTENRMKCGKCGCNIKLKVKVASETCPLKYW